MIGNDTAGPPKSGLILLLAAAAALVLAVGALLRPGERSQERPISLTEGATLRALSHREELRGMADFLRDRAAAAGRHLIYLDAHRSGGVVWGPARAAVITGSDQAPLQGVELSPAGSGAAAVPAAPDRLTRRGWMLAAARQPDGALTWSVGIYGGTTVAACGASEYRQLVLSVPLAAPFAGGGVFDLDGNLLGIVARCGEGYAALAVTEVPAILAAPRVRERDAGMTVTALDTLARRYFGAESGILVASVLLGGPASAAGLRPGDVIGAIDGKPVAAPEELTPLLEPGSEPHALTVVRRGRIHRLTLPPERTGAAAGLSLAPPAQGVELAAVAPGSRADRAGLQPGDRIVQLGFLQQLTPASTLRTLESSRDPVYLVFRRGPEHRGVFLLP